MRDRPSSPRAALHAALAATVSVAGNDAAGFERRVDAVLDHLAGDGWELVDTQADHEADLNSAVAAASEALPRQRFRVVPDPESTPDCTRDLKAELEAAIAAAKQARRQEAGA